MAVPTSAQTLKPNYAFLISSNSYYELSNECGILWKILASIYPERQTGLADDDAPTTDECVNHWPLRERHGGTLPTYTFYHTTLLLSTKVISIETQYFGMFVCHLLLIEVVGRMRENISRHSNCHRKQQRFKKLHKLYSLKHCLSFVDVIN